MSCGQSVLVGVFSTVSMFLCRGTDRSEIQRESSPLWRQIICVLRVRRYSVNDSEVGLFVAVFDEAEADEDAIKKLDSRSRRRI